MLFVKYAIARYTHAHYLPPMDSTPTRADCWGFVFYWGGLAD